MMTPKLIGITNAKPRDKAYNTADFDGLYLVVQKNHAELLRINYRHFCWEKTVYFGAWPEAGIAMARERTEERQKELARA